MTTGIRRPVVRDPAVRTSGSRTPDPDPRLFRPHRFERADGSRLARRQIRGDQTHRKQQSGHAGERRGVDRLGFAQQAAEELRQDGGAERADDEPGCRDGRGVGQILRFTTAGLAPSASRTPISRVRRVTAYDRTP